MARIVSKFITDDAVTSAKIAADAVGTSEIAADAVGASELANNAVDANAIATDAVTSAKILADAVTDAKIRLSNNAYMRARNAADSADINMLKVNASDVIEFASFPQKSGTPSNNDDLANKSYVDSVAGSGTAGAVAKQAVHFVYDGASDPLTVGSSGTYDGYTPSAGDRFLYTGSFDSNSERGIYSVVNGTTSARSTDADAASEFAFGQLVQLMQMQRVSLHLVSEFRLSLVMFMAALISL